MLKLLIVDDEEIICNTIAKVIPWEELGITLVGTCLDGVEAYHTILDESPDIVHDGYPHARHFRSGTY